MHLELLLDELDNVGLLEGGGPAPQHRGTLLRQAQEQRLGRQITHYLLAVLQIRLGPN